MSSELKPCPFCGKTGYHEPDCYIMMLICQGPCCAQLFTEDEWRKAWNKRAERTCNRVIKTSERPGKTVFNQWYACSECGNPMGSGENFCASCGAKVVGD